MADEALSKREGMRQQRLWRLYDDYLKASDPKEQERIKKKIPKAAFLRFEAVSIACGKAYFEMLLTNASHVFPKWYRQAEGRQRAGDATARQRRKNGKQTLVQIERTAKALIRNGYDAHKRGFAKEVWRACCLRVSHEHVCRSLKKIDLSSA